MADDIKLSLSQSRNSVEQLSRNFKSLKSVKVDPPKDEQRGEKDDNVSASFTAVTDSVRLSAEAVKSLANSGKQDNGTTDDSDVANSNLQASQSDHIDLKQANRLASDAGLSVQLFRDRALSAHSGINPKRVLELLSIN